MSDLLEVDEVDDRPRRIRVGRHGQADYIALLVGLVEQHAPLVVELHRPEWLREGWPSRRVGRDARALRDPPVRMPQIRIRILRERILLVEGQVLPRPRHPLPLPAPPTI